MGDIVLWNQQYAEVLAYQDKLNIMTERKW